MLGLRTAPDSAASVSSLGSPYCMRYLMRQVEMKAVEAPVRPHGILKLSVMQKDSVWRWSAHQSGWRIGSVLDSIEKGSCWTNGRLPYWC